MRTPYAPGVRRDKTIWLRLKSSELTHLEDIAQAFGMSVSDALRRLIREAQVEIFSPPPSSCMVKIECLVCRSSTMTSDVDILPQGWKNVTTTSFGFLPVCGEPCERALLG